MDILNNDEVEFLRKELSISEKDLASMTEERWKRIRSACFDIEADELLTLSEQGYDIDEYATERSEIAGSIASIKYADLLAKGIAV